MPLVREETHRVIRKYKDYKDFFFRLTLTSEYLDKIHFGNDSMRIVLDYFTRVLGQGVRIGPGAESQIINYSNS